MIVYRVEHESIKNREINFPCGPFQDSDVMTSLSKDYFKMDAYMRAIDVLMRRLNADTYKFPTPVNDWNLGWIDTYQVCGVDSLEAVHEWFGEALPLLEEVGFRVAKYDVPDRDVKCGRTGQVVFRIQHATKIEEINDDRQDA